MSIDQTFFRDLVARSRDAIITIDENSTVLFANDGVETVLGYDPDELEGEPLTTLMPDRFVEQHEAAISRYIRTEERTLDWNDIELPAEHADGHEVPLSITFEEHEYDGHRLFSGIMRDVTLRVEREQRLERQNEQLERFASYVSHDLRDPLNTARTTMALMQAAEAEAERDQYVGDLEDILNRMEERIEDVLTLAEGSRSVGSLEPVSLGDVAREAWKTAGREGATLEVASDGTIEADRGRLQALLENLLGNAVEHGTPGGATDGAADTAADDGTGGEAPSVRVTVGVTGEGFFVADDGPGVPPTERENVFKRGYTTSDSGSGLGLDIVRTIAEAHDWEVSVSESERGGARFDITPE